MNVTSREVLSQIGALAERGTQAKVARQRGVERPVTNPEARSPESAGRAESGPARPAEADSAKQAPASHQPAPIELPELRDTQLLFRLENDIGRVVVQVIDRESKSVLLSIPPEQVVRALKERSSDPRGVLFDEEA